MQTMEVISVPPRNQESISNSNQNSDSNGSDLFIHLGHYHYKRTVNGDVDQEFNVPIVVESVSDLDSTMKQIREEIVDGEIQITIHRTREYWDDIPSPPTEDFNAAIAIKDNYELPEIEVPETQQTNSPSWDSD